jgi:hypothetical protein
MDKAIKAHWQQGIGCKSCVILARSTFTHLSLNAVLFGTPTTVGRMFSAEQLALSYGC